MIFLMIIIIYNLIYYLPCLIYFDLMIQIRNESNLNESGLNVTQLKTKCLIVDEKLDLILPIMDLINRVII
jgi:hypothetical protein